MALHTISVEQALAALPAFPVLRGRSVHLRQPRIDDADALFELFSQPQVTRYWSRPPMQALAEAEGLLAEMDEAFAARRMLHWLVTTRSDDAAIGTCTLFHFDPRNRCADIGYALLPECWGRGLASEAVALVLAWGFDNLGLQRIEADVDPRNARSRQLLERLGFHSEGVMRGRLALGDAAREAEVFALSIAAWRDELR
ncbi:MAG TPA: GNAT family N-acetyltransferase [Lysobacter sp.]|nr:GNAT family N-acetyltransferase [Lysobacter sp.]